MTDHVATGAPPAIVVRPMSRRALAVKRAADVVVAVVTAPVVVVLSLLVLTAVLLADGRPVLFVQQRVGKDGRTFGLVKFRTMFRDADERLQSHLAANPARAAEWARVFKLERDPRVLPVVGNLLRRTSLDELPNLWNLLRGDLTLVGPRPFPRYHLDAFDDEFVLARQSVAPGITGPWQIGRGGVEDQRRLDLDYLARRSLAHDANLLVRTVPVVLGAKRHY